MFKGTVPNIAYTASANIPITKLFNTNNKIQLNPDNTISLRTPGLKNIRANIVFTPTAAGSIQFSLFSKGELIPGAVDVITVTETDSITLSIDDAIRVIPTLEDDYASIYLQIDQAGELITGSVIVENVN